jgi:hypothetical protein
MSDAMSDDYSWGSPDAEGIALGLKVIDGARGAYRIAVANRSSEPRAVVLFATLDDKIRTRIIARQSGREEVDAAVVPSPAPSSNVRIVVEVPPGHVIERDGVPTQFQLTGDVTLQVVLGGVKARPDLLVSGEVPAKL